MITEARIREIVREELEAQQHQRHPSLCTGGSMVGKLAVNALVPPPKPSPDQAPPLARNIIRGGDAW